MDHLFDVPRPREGARRRRTGRPYRRSRPWRLGGDGLGSPPLTGPLRGATLRASEEEASASDMALEVSAKGRGSVPSRKEFRPRTHEKRMLGTSSWARDGRATRTPEKYEKNPDRGGTDRRHTGEEETQCTYKPLHRVACSRRCSRARGRLVPQVRKSCRNPVLTWCARRAPSLGRRRRLPDPQTLGPAASHPEAPCKSRSTAACTFPALCRRAPRASASP